MSTLHTVRVNDEEIVLVFVESLQRKKPELREARRMGPLEAVVKMGKAGGLWLLTIGGRLLLDLQTCNFRLGVASPWALVRTDKACQGRHPEPAEPEPSVQAEGKGM